MADERPTFGSLFAGIGGIDLGLERAGWTGRWQVEWDEYCRRVLAKHWPDIPRYGDITAVDWSRVERVDLLAGGFPCQPISSAGRQTAQADERWLWPEFYRAIRDLRPPFVLVENVANLLAVNDGSAFGEVVGDLAESGYDAVWDCLPAGELGAPHDRDRLWITAYRVDDARTADAAATYAASLGLEKPGWLGRRSDPAATSDRQANHVVDGRGWSVEPDVGRVAHGVPSRVDRLRSLGNAVVPQVVEVIGRRLLEVIEAERAA